MTHQNGGITGTILKARLGSDVRKTSLHHSNDLTLIDLLLSIQRIFNIPSDKNIVLKYKDSEGDLISLVEDNDLLLALHTETSKTGILDVTVVLETKAYQFLKDVQQQVDQLKGDVSQLFNFLSSFDDVSSLMENCTITGKQNESLGNDGYVQKNFVSPPSPIPTEQPEVPATIQPSLQEQVHHSGLVEEEISLENSFQEHNVGAQQADDVLSTTSTNIDQHQQYASPPSIPSFPTSNSGPPPQEYLGQQPPISQFGQYPPQTINSQSSVSSTPVPHSVQPHDQYNQGPPPPQQQQQQHHQPQQFQQPPQNFGAPQQYEQPPQSHQQVNNSQFHAPPQQTQPVQGFSPAAQSNQGFTQPPQSFNAVPPPQNGPPQGFIPPPQIGQGYAPPPPLGSTGMAPPQNQSSGFAPPSQSGFGGFAPPPQNAPGSFPPQGPPSSFAPPSSIQQGFSAPPTGFAPPGSATGNPFARGPGGPGYRQSPYQ